LLSFLIQPDFKDLSQDLRASYAVATLEKAASALDRFEDSLGDKYPAIGPSWRAAWDRLTALFDFPPAIRKVFYTTNAIESLNYSLCKVLKNRDAFPNDESIQKILYLALAERLEQKEPVDSRLDGSAQSIRHIIRRSGASLICSYTVYLARP